MCAWQEHIVGSSWFTQICTAENFMRGGRSALCMAALYPILINQNALQHEDANLHRYHDNNSYRNSTSWVSG